MVQPNASLADPDRGLRWGVERRMEFIDFRLYWEGRINRADLMRFFGVSVQQASADIARYQELAPDNLTYDRSAKRYLAGADYRPVFKVDDSDRYLAQLRSLGEKLIQPEEAWMAEIPSFQTLPLPSRPIEPAILRAAITAIRQKTAIASVVAATEEYFEAEDALGRWLDECCRLGHSFTETTANLFAAWKGWADAAGEFAGSQKRFCENLIARNFEKWREPGTGQRGFRGLTLNDAARRTSYPEIYL